MLIHIIYQIINYTCDKLIISGTCSFRTATDVTAFRTGVESLSEKNENAAQSQYTIETKQLIKR